MNTKQKKQIDWQKTGQRVFEGATVASTAYVFARAMRVSKEARAGLTLSALYLWAVARNQLDELERRAVQAQRKPQPKTEAPPPRDAMPDEPISLWDRFWLKCAAETLGVDEAATADEIRSAFRRKLLEVHPDHGGDAEATRELIEARDLLLSHAKEKDHGHR